MSDALFDEVKSYLTRFVSFPNEAAADVATLWVAHTHAVDSEHKLIFESTPRLAILSNEPGSGKTRLLELIEALSHNGRQVTDPTAPALISLVNDERAAICIDEIDVLFTGGNGQRPVRSFLNAGYRHGAKIARYGKMSDCFAPIALAGMGANFTSNESLRPLYTRSVIIRMAKKEGNCGVDSYRERMHGPIARGLNKALSDWGQNHALELTTAWPTLPNGVDNRDADVWEPLVATAECAGPEWSKRAQAACRAIVLADVVSDPSLTPTEALVKALARVWKGERQLPTATIITRLMELPDAPYKNMWPNPRTAAMELSALLRPLKIEVTKIRTGERSLQGYKLEQFLPHFPKGN